jgi:hypothetical protein
LLPCLLILTSCAKPTPPPLPPEEIVANVVARMKALTGFSFVLEREGGPAYMDIENQLSLGRLEGDFTSPDRAQGQVRVIAPGMVANIKFISLGEQFWQTNPLTGAWEECPPGACFDPATLFDPQVGIQPILESDLLEPKLEGSVELEELPGKPLYAISGHLKGERLYEMSWGMIGPDTMVAHLWVDPTSFDLIRIQIEEPATEGSEATQWKLDLLNFNQIMNIQPPSTPTP